jgi:hypothetical protein
MFYPSRFSARDKISHYRKAAYGGKAQTGDETWRSGSGVVTIREALSFSEGVAWSAVGSDSFSPGEPRIGGHAPGVSHREESSLDVLCMESKAVEMACAAWVLSAYALPPTPGWMPLPSSLADPPLTAWQPAVHTNRYPALSVGRAAASVWPRKSESKTMKGHTRRFVLHNRALKVNRDNEDGCLRQSTHAKGTQGCLEGANLGAGR